VALLVALLAATTGCAPFGPQAQATPTPDCGLARRCEVLLPPCGPAVSPAPGDAGEWYYGRQMPRNAAALLGFQPLLPTHIAGTGSWDSALLIGPRFGPGRVPLLRQVYAPWPPHTGATDGGVPVVDTRPSRDATLVLDETTGAPGPLTSFNGGYQQPLHIAEQRAVLVGDASATLFHLAAPDTPAADYQAIELLWHAGPVTLRLFSAFDDGYFLSISDDSRSPTTDVVLGFDVTIDLDARLLQTAETVAPYTGCGP
jgi:hypothetical protein